MRVVEHDGERYLLIKASGQSSLVKNPNTGNERYLPNDELTVTGEPPLHLTAKAIPEPQRRILTAVHSEQLLGLLVELDTRGPLSAREIIDISDFCESDLHGQLLELRAAGLIEETKIGAERGYALTELGSEGVSALR